MSHRPTRRQFLQTTTAAGFGYWVAAGATAKESQSPNEQIAMASIGIEGKGRSDSADAARLGRMVAICDVDDKRLERAGRRNGFEGARKFNDFRKMLDEMGRSIDAVTVSTPDHIHAPAAAMAMRMGKHCFVQKPLTHSIHEARVLAELARKHKVATQMGNQGSASDALRRSVTFIRAGGLGQVSEVHIWTNRPIWPQGLDRPPPMDPPSQLHWDLWIGPAPVRPYAELREPDKQSRRKDVYHPFSWRGWWDFGTGALGDIACHTMNMPFRALDLRNPVSVQAETAGHNKDSFPSWSIITYQFAATLARTALKLVWYDGGKFPPDEVLDGRTPSRGGGTVVIGSRGKLHGENYQSLGVAESEIKFTKSPGHFEEWVRAIRGGEPAMSNFPDYAAPLTETALLGNLAVWVASSGKGPNVEWDAANRKVKNLPGLEGLIERKYRAGYSL